MAQREVGSSNEAAVPEKLRLDLQANASIVRVMDDTYDDRAALAVMLLLEAGRLMEDISPEFASALPDEAAISARVEHLDHIGSDLRALAAAARVLLRLTSPDQHNFG